MAIKVYKPTTNGRRDFSVVIEDCLTGGDVPKKLLAPKNKKAGRNAHGKITVRHRGGGNKKKYRIIDFKRNKEGVATVKEIQYDPNRTANIALLEYKDGELAYILSPMGLRQGDTVVSGADSDIKTGNCLPIENIPVGTMIHAIEIYPGKGAQLVRSAGNAAQLMAKDDDTYAQVRLPSGEVRLIRRDCRATIGVVGNSEHQNESIGTAGRKRHRGWRPTVRGSVMNPCDHPHGGGEGKSPVGRPSPVTPWGKPALGYKTRKTKNPTDKYIVKRRKAAKSSN